MNQTLNSVLGILGGGQLGKMLLQKAADFNITSHVLDPDPDAPCKNLCSVFVNESFKDFDAVMRFGKNCDIITVEIEHVNVDALSELEKAGKKVFPQPRILKMVQDKGLQKLFYRENKIPTTDFYLVENKAEIKKDKFPIIQKTRKSGYDGKGVLKINNEQEIDAAFDEPCVMEECLEYFSEISVIAARNENKQVEVFPIVEMVFNKDANLVDYLYSPVELRRSVYDRAVNNAVKIISELDMVGVLAVEMFVTPDDKIYVNEIAPRPHNSGHHTIEANFTSQYEQHLRAIFNLPLGSTGYVFPAVMLNLLGEKGYEGSAKYEGLEEVLKMEGVHVHLYGKKITKPFRKMGHVTILHKSVDAALKEAMKIKKILKVVA